MSPEQPLTEDSRLRPADGVLSRILGGEAVLVSLGSGEYFGLNAVGTRIWELVGETGEVGLGADSRHPARRSQGRSICTVGRRLEANADGTYAQAALRLGSALTLLWG